MMSANVGMHPGASENNQSQTNLPQRKNLRAKFHDYSGGVYFITICTADKAHYFGKIQNGVMNFTELGNFANDALETLASHYNYVEVPLFVVMPNHIHAIIAICDRKNGADAPGCIPTVRTALGVVVGGYKQSITRYARRHNINFDWQKGYHDHIIRNNNDATKITEYIKNNVEYWNSDCYNDTAIK